MTATLSLTRRALLGSSMLVAAMPAFGAERMVYRDPAAPIGARIADLLARMTIDEKAAQLRCAWVDKVKLYDDRGDFSPSKARAAMPHGFGQISRPGDYRGLDRWVDDPFRTVENTVKFVNDVQRYLVEETRLGIPALFHDELAHGLLAGDATVFPIPPALASSWDTALVEQVFAAAAGEARSRGATIALTPVIDLLRDPRFGRAEEFFGEDPHLVGEMGVAAVRGLQGRSRPLGPDRVFATLKHFVHGVPQGGLNISPFEVSERALRETWLVPFAQVVKRADPAIIMPSYNEVGGEPAHASRRLLQETGRNLLGFRGLYMSDYEGVGNLATQHHTAEDAEGATVQALNAGVQVDLPEGASFQTIPQLVREGRVPEALVDAAVAKVLALKFEAGLFERPYVDAGRARRNVAAPANARLARQAAEKALILLKNDGLLPLRPTSGTKIAVIGPNAVEPLFGGYSGQAMQAVGILEGIKRQAPPGVVIEHADGVWITPPDKLGRHRSYSQTEPVPAEDNRKRIAQAIEVARRADVIVLAVGDVPAITREAVHISLAGDRRTLNLWGEQDELIDALSQTGRPIVAVLLSGRPLAVENLARKTNALFQGWYLGQAGGLAFADALFGNVNPGGKLTVSMPRSVGDLPIYYDRHPSADTNQYVEGPRTPLFPFGHGLSYTRFDISAPRLAKERIGLYESVDLEVDVANIGERAGDEVIQIYLRDEVSSVPRPILELKAFRRITLAPGERRTLRFQLDSDALALWDSEMRYVVEPGVFTISAGASSASLKSVKLTVQAVSSSSG